MPHVSNVELWIGFSLFVIFALSVDTFLLRGKISTPNKSIKAALYWTLVWVISALIFNIILWLILYQQNPAFANQKALEFFTGYLIEKSLSVDNLFVFYMVFTQLKIPIQYQHRVFTYGIWSAIILRFVFIMFLSWAILTFHWLFYVMGAFLILTGLKMFFVNPKDKDVKNSTLLLLIKKYFHLTDTISGQQFFIKKDHKLYFTPLFVALIFIELSDVIFAFDSIPAIFAITTDPFIVWTSNIFAILGLRALYFVLSGMAEKFELLKYGLGLIVIFVGSKMLLTSYIHIPVAYSLIVIVTILIFFVLFSHFKSSHREKI